MSVCPHTADAAPEQPTYRSVLQLDALLDLQPPDTGDGRAMGVALEKHFFIVMHQAFELWFKQIIQDIDGAIADLGHGESSWPAAVTKLERVAVVQTLLVQQMRLLLQLDRAAFLTFRGEFGTASAAQSSQFYEIQKRLGLLRDDDPGPLWTVLYRCSEGSAGGGEPSAETRSRVIDVVDELSGTWLCLWATHVSSVECFIGDQAGTGGTSGVSHLRRNLAKLKVRAASVRAVNPSVEGRARRHVVRPDDDTTEAVSSVVMMDGQMGDRHQAESLDVSVAARQDGGSDA